MGIKKDKANITKRKAKRLQIARATIAQCFIWTSTIEGDAFWRKVQEGLDRLIKLADKKTCPHCGHTIKEDKT